MLLAIDVGNTHTVLGLFDGPDLVEHWRIATEAHRTADEIAVVLRGLLAQHEEVAPGGDATVDGIALCSTVPSVLHEMREVCVRYYGDVPAVAPNLPLWGGPRPTPPAPAQVRPGRGGSTAPPLSPPACGRVPGWAAPAPGGC